MPQLTTAVLIVTTCLPHWSATRHTAEHAHVFVCSYVLTAGRLIAPIIERSGPVAGFDWCIDALTGAQHSGLASEVALAKAAWFLNHQAFGDAVSVLKVGCPCTV